MNDELTPDERAAMRARIVGGARGIRPVGAHRNAWIAGSVAVALVAAVAGGVVATSTLSAPQIATTPTPSPTATTESTPTPTQTPTPTPSPTPAAAAPAVAFGGQCSRMLDDFEARNFVSDAAPWTWGDGIEATPPSSPDIHALLGGLSCWWGGEQESFGVTVLPRSVVPTSIIETWQSTLRCDLGIVCLAEQTVGDLWVGVQWYEPGWPQEQTFSESSEIDRVRASAQAVLAMVLPRAQVASGAPQPDLALSPLPECASFDDVVAQWAGAELEAGYPTDWVPSGPIWDITVAAGANRYCGWHLNPAESMQSPLAVEFYIQPLLGAPRAEDLRSTGMAYRDIPGTSSAWLKESVENPGSVRMIVDVGGTRVTVAGGGRSTAEWNDLVSRLADAVSAPGDRG
jgi:hypothetical protein